MTDGHDRGRLLDQFKANSDGHWVVLTWKKSDATPLRIAVLRSEQGFAEKAEEVTDIASGQHLLYEGVDDYCQDQDVVSQVDYYYTCFARREDAAWERQHTCQVKPKLAHERQRREVFDADDPAYLQAMDRMRAGLWLGRIGAP
jgi:hypothetical protein